MLNLSSKSENWMVACAETLSEIDFPASFVSIFEVLLDVESERVKIATLDTLNSMIQQESTLPLSLRQHILSTVKVYQGASAVDKQVIESLVLLLG